MPQIGSLAVGGRGGPRARSRARPPAHLDDRGEDRERYLGRRAGADVEARRRVDAARAAPRARRLRAVRRARPRRACGWPRARRSGRRASSAARRIARSSRPWAATTTARSSADGVGGAAVVAPRVDGLEPQLRPEAQQRRGDRRVAGDDHPRRGQERLEEHLDRAARQTRVLNRHRAFVVATSWRRVGFLIDVGARSSPRRCPGRRGGSAAAAARRARSP